MLPQHRKKNNPPYYNFAVFSIIDDSDTCIPKYAQCNNCGVVHRVVDLCRSEIISGRDELSSVTSVDDLKVMLSSDIVQVMESYSCTLPSYEHVHFIISNAQWGDFIVLTRDSIDDEQQGKLLRFIGPGKIIIESFMQDFILRREE